MDEAHQFLDNLRGQWLLTGQMGAVPLRQRVSARWTLSGKFLWLYFKSETEAGNPTNGYEAVYHLGYNQRTGMFMLYLLDTTEVPLDCVVGRGLRAGNRIPFLFEYPEAPFYNTFIWLPEQNRWRMEQTYEEAGELKTFAVKELRRLDSGSG